MGPALGLNSLPVLSLLYSNPKEAVFFTGGPELPRPPVIMSERPDTVRNKPPALHSEDNI